MPAAIELEAIQADITQLSVDAVVNAANATLLSGGGVDSAIHRAAGPQLRELCKTLGGCDVGMAKITEGFDLPAKYVIHTVGPIWHGGHEGEAEQLASCYRESLELAIKHKLNSIAFPAISTGAFGYPLNTAANIAVQAVTDYLKQQSHPIKVIFCCYDKLALKIYEQCIATYS